MLAQGRGAGIFPSTGDLKQMGELAVGCNTSEEGGEKKKVTVDHGGGERQIHTVNPLAHCTAEGRDLKGLCQPPAVLL